MKTSKVSLFLAAAFALAVSGLKAIGERVADGLFALQVRTGAIQCATLQSLQVKRGDVVPSANGATDLIPIVGDYTLSGSEASGDEIDMVVLPAGYVPVDIIVDAEDCGTTATTDCGLMSGTPGSLATRTCGAEFMAAKALGTAGVYRMDVVGSSRIAPTTADRSIGLGLTTVSTPTAGAKIRMTVMARPQVEGV